MIPPFLVGIKKMSDTEKLIDEMLSKCTNISREEILKRLENKRKSSGGLISDDTLLRIIAAELGVKVSKETKKTKLSIADLVPGLGDVTVVGRVIAVFPAKTSEKKNGTVKFASLLLADKSGVMRVVLWNDKASISEKVKIGEIAEFSHGYTKESLLGRVELHIGEKGEATINPENIDEKNYPTITELTTKIGSITAAHKNKRINLRGTVAEISNVSTFQKRDSNLGRVMRLFLKDKTGKVPVVFWNEKVDEIEKELKTGLELQLVNAKVKKAASEGFEVHVDNETYFQILRPGEKTLKIAQLREGLIHVNVAGEISTNPIIREVKTINGETIKVATFELKDETGKIWVSTWRQHAETVQNMKKGEKILVKNAYTKKGFNNQLEIATSKTTTITTQSQNAHS